MTGAGVDESGPKHCDLVRLLSYWHDRRGARTFPQRVDIDPLDLRFMLDRITLTEGPRESAALPVAPGRLLVEGPGRIRSDRHVAGRLAAPEPAPHDVRELRDGDRRPPPLWSVRDLWMDDKRLSHEILWAPALRGRHHDLHDLTGIGPV
jgi:PAS domain